MLGVRVARPFEGDAFSAAGAAALAIKGRSLAVFNKSIRNLDHRVVLSEDKVGDLGSRSGAATSATALHMSGCAHTEREHGVLELLLQGFD